MKGFIELIKNCNQKYKDIIITGDFNAKSNLRGNVSENSAGDLLERFMLTENFICINDGLKTRRNSDSVIDLFLIKPHLNKFITKCQALIQETV